MTADELFRGLDGSVIPSLGRDRSVVVYSIQAADGRFWVQFGFADDPSLTRMLNIPATADPQAALLAIQKWVLTPENHQEPLIVVD